MIANKLLNWFRRNISNRHPCIRCGKPRDNQWLLACVSCYRKEHPEERWI